MSRRRRRETSLRRRIWSRIDNYRGRRIVDLGRVVRVASVSAAADSNCGSAAVKVKLKICRARLPLRSCEEYDSKDYRDDYQRNINITI